MATKSPSISVVVPVRNEEATVEELARRLADHLPPDHEIVFVDDGSTDATWQRLGAVHAPGRVRLVRLRAPRGKSAALMAGFARVRAPIVFTLDGDLQDHPEDIPAFLAKLNEGYDLVCGWKRVRRDPLHKVAASRVFNFVMRQVTGIPLRDMNCGYKCYRRKVVQALRIYGDQHRFIPVLAAHLGYRIAEVEVRHRARRHGRSKYGFSRLPKGLLDLGTIMLRTRYSGRPAHAFGLAAAACAAASVILLALAGPGWLPPALAAVSFAKGIVLACGAAAFLAAGWLAEVSLDRAPGDPSALSAGIEEVRD